MKSIPSAKGWNPSKRQWFRSQLRAWGEDNLRDFPWRRTEDPYAWLVGECLLQQTQAARVVPVYEQFLTSYPIVEDLASAPLSQVSQLLHPLGFHFRASRLSQLAKAIVRDWDGKVPESEEELLKLPGVGPYTTWKVNT